MGDLLRFDPIARRIGTEPAKQRLEELLATDDAEARVRALDPLYVYGLVRTVGADDALPVLHLVSGAQAQAFVDFDCWTGDRLALNRLEGWLAVHLQGSDEHVAEVHRRLDPELLGLLLKDKVQVYFYEDEEDAEIIENLDGPIESSPDGAYAIVMPEEPGEAELVRTLIRRLYAADQDAARQLLNHARHELVSQLEETAYQMRVGRIEQHGFLRFDEALEIYAPVNPARERKAAETDLAAEETSILGMRIEGPVAVPVGLAQDLLRVTDESEGSFVGRAMRQAADTSGELETADVLLLQLRTLINRVVMTDRRRPGDPDDTRSALARVHGLLNVGLEYATASDSERASRLITRWPLKRLLRIGFSLVTSLAAQAQTLVERGALSLVDELPYSLCSASEAALLEGLLEPRPVRSADEESDFGSLAEVQTAARALAQLAYKSLWAFADPAMSRDDLLGLVFAEGAGVPIEDITFDALLATRAALSALSDSAGRRLLTLDEVGQLIDEHIHDDALSTRLADALATVAEPPQSADPSARPLSARWTVDITVQLIESYGGLHRTAIDAPHLLPPLLLWTR